MIFVISRFGFWVLIASVPDLRILFTFPKHSLVGVPYANRKTLIRLADAHAYPGLCWALLWLNHSFIF